MYSIEDFMTRRTLYKVVNEFVEAFVSLVIVASISYLNSSEKLDLVKVIPKLIFSSLILGIITTVLEKYNPSYEKTFKNNILIFMSSALIGRLAVKA